MGSTIDGLPALWQAERAALKGQLATAQMTAQALRDASQRVAALESGIAATRERARHMMGVVERKR
jgi:hypothetical protein